VISSEKRRKDKSIHLLPPLFIVRKSRRYGEWSSSSIRICRGRGGGRREKRIRAHSAGFWFLYWCTQSSVPHQSSRPSLLCLP
jgi:hypothetical protein